MTEKKTPLKRATSRQLLFQRREVREGRCATGDGRKLARGSVRYCAACLMRRRLIERERKGLQPWKRGNRGRPPIVREEAGLEALRVVEAEEYARKRREAAKAAAEAEVAAYTAAALTRVADFTLSEGKE